MRRPFQQSKTARPSLIALTAPRYRGEIPLGQPSPVLSYRVWEKVTPTDWGEVCHRFEDEYLAMHCALALGAKVETVRAGELY